MFTTEEKLAEIGRELALRRRVYPRMVARGELSAPAASKRLSILREIMADYADADASNAAQPESGEPAKLAGERRGSSETRR